MSGARGWRNTYERARLVIAAFELDVAKVQALLKDDAGPNERLKLQERSIFEDKWTLGSPIGSIKWTPLMAVANSHRVPQPKERAENTSEGLDAARKKRDSLDPKLIIERDKRRVAIAKLLIAAQADLDLDDGYGATALAASVYKYHELSLLLIESGAKLDTKTGVYIDGPGDITPLHRAVDSPHVLEAMLKRGAKVDVRATDGEMPLHWAARHGNLASVKLLLENGADANAKDEQRKTPFYWCETFEGIEPTEETATKKAILKLLAKPPVKK
jgi:ankyrin repeat protein